MSWREPVLEALRRAAPQVGGITLDDSLSLLNDLGLSSRQLVELSTHIDRAAGRRVPTEEWLVNELFRRTIADWRADRVAGHQLPTPLTALIPQPLRGANVGCADPLRGANIGCADPLRGANIGCADPLRGANIGCADVTLPVRGSGGDVDPCSPLPRQGEGQGVRALLNSEVHLWYVEPETIGDPALLDAYDALLAPSERARNRRFVFARHRHQDLVTRALVRSVLSAYHPSVDPRAWAFQIGEFGRPEIAAPDIQPTVRFNLSHTDGMIVCLVAGDREVGVDVEDTWRTGYTVEIADRYFSPAEVRELRSWPAERQAERFFDYWTLKEAYIKARGLGLQIPLDQFTMQPPNYRPGERAARSASIAFGPEIDDDPQTWQFTSLDLTARHRVALAVRRREADLALRIMQTVPLTSGQPAWKTGGSGVGGHVHIF